MDNANVCLCGCGNIIKKNKKYVSGHNARINPPINNLKKAWELNKIPIETRTCACGCGKTFVCRINSNKKVVRGHNKHKEDCQCNFCLSIRGKKNFWKGKKHSEEAKLKIGLAGIGRVGSNRGKNKYNDPRCLKLSIERTGKGNPAYIDGRSKIKNRYPKEFDKYLKKIIKERDNYICNFCGISEEQHLEIFGRELSVHHINYRKNKCYSHNLITLCNVCNIKANTNRSEWEQFYLQQVNTLITKKHTSFLMYV